MLPAFDAPVDHGAPRHHVPRGHPSEHLASGDEVPALGVPVKERVPGDEAGPGDFVEHPARVARQGAGGVRMDEGVGDVEVGGEETEPQRVRVERGHEGDGGQARGGAGEEGEGEVGRAEGGAEEEDEQGEGEGGRRRVGGGPDEGVEELGGERAAVEVAEEMRGQWRGGRRRRHEQRTDQGREFGDTGMWYCQSFKMGVSI